MNRDSIIKGLMVLTAVALVAFVGFLIVRTFLNLSQKELKTDTSAPATLESNETLKATIDTLESTWQSVQNYNFNVTQDPLFLGRVIKDFSYAQTGFKESDEEESIRLTATVIDSNPKAIIKYNGKSYVVQTGETFSGIYRVVSIEKQQVTLDHGGARIILVTRPAQEMEPRDNEPSSDLSNSGGLEGASY